MFTSLTRSKLLLERVDAAELGYVKLTDQYRQLEEELRRCWQRTPMREVKRRGQCTSMAPLIVL